MNALPSPAVLLEDLKSVISQRAAAGMGMPELGIPPPPQLSAPAAPATPPREPIYGHGASQASDSKLRRLLVEKLGVQYGLRDDVFHQVVRLELDALLAARDRLRHLEGNQSQLAAVDRTWAAASEWRGDTPHQPARPATLQAALDHAAGGAGREAPGTNGHALAGPMPSHTSQNSGNSAGTFTAVANVNKSFDMLLERAWAYRRRSSAAKEELLEHWEVLSGLMEEGHVSCDTALLAPRQRAFPCASSRVHAK